MPAASAARDTLGTARGRVPGVAQWDLAPGGSPAAERARLPHSAVNRRHSHTACAGWSGQRGVPASCPEPVSLFSVFCFGLVFLQLQPVYGDPLIRRPESLCEKFSHPEVPPARKSRPRVQVVLNFFFLFALLAGFLKNYFVYIPQSPPFGNHQSVLRI